MENGFVNIKNNYYNSFLWCHIRHLNPLKTHPERIAKVDRRVVIDLDYADVIATLNGRITFALMYFVMKVIWFILFMYQIKKNLEIYGFIVDNR